MRKIGTRLIQSCDGQQLRGMFAAAARSLERSAQTINALNVFPVPDGDTGTNMVLTMRAAMKEAGRCPDTSAGAIAQALARGALMGARGNSGVILSQILRGLARGLEGKEHFTGADLVAALEESASFAYRGVSKPVEGTILTVVREAARAAREVGADSADILSVLQATVSEARASVARTPTLLPVLRQAGVVDAGGQGLYVVLEGALRHLRGEVEEVEAPGAEALPGVAAEIAQRLGEEEGGYGYCTEFLLEGQGLDPEAVREKLASLGESVMVVGDQATVRAHLHTFDPGAALSFVTSLGTLHQVKVQNMQEQHRDFIAARAAIISAPTPAIATVAVVSGQGLAEVFRSLGLTAVVPGGQTMNPSVQQLLSAVEAAPAEGVIILPNNPNILMAADQARAASRKNVVVVPTESIPQGVAALLAFDPEAELETNARAMTEARARVRSGEVTTAVRSMSLGQMEVREGQAIALLEEELVAAGDEPVQVAHQLLEKMGVEEGDLITLYYGADVRSETAEGLAESLRQGYPGQEVEIVNGGQPHYSYIVSVE